MPLVDTHNHLQHEQFNDDRAEVLERALAALDWMVVIGNDLATSQAAVESVRDRVYAAVGIHPHDASTVTPEVLAEIQTLASQPGVVAIGEIGLDYHYDLSPRACQRDIFRQQLEMAIACTMPVVVHSREAESDTADILEPLYAQLAGGVMHCFGGNAHFAEQCLAWGFYVSFAGNVTFPKAQQLRDAAQVVPLDRLLVETDSPYLAPQPVRGRRCEPIHVLHTAACLAELKGVTLEELAEATSANARRVFRL